MPLTDTRDLQRLAKWRHVMKLLKEQLAEAEKRVLETPEGKKLTRAKQAILDIRGGIVETEATIRGTALEHYDGTGEREAWPGVKVKLFKVVDYEPREALIWAQRNAPYMLILDVKAFDRALKADLIVHEGWVTEEPRAQIARDLSEYLPSGGEPEPEEDEREDLPI